MVLDLDFFFYFPWQSHLNVREVKCVVAAGRCVVSHNHQYTSRTRLYIYLFLQSTTWTWIDKSIMLESEFVIGVLLFFFFWVLTSYILLSFFSSQYRILHIYSIFISMYNLIIVHWMAAWLDCRASVKIQIFLFCTLFPPVTPPTTFNWHFIWSNSDRRHWQSATKCKHAYIYIYAETNECGKVRKEVFGQHTDV